MYRRVYCAFSGLFSLPRTSTRLLQQDVGQGLLHKRVYMLTFIWPVVVGLLLLGSTVNATADLDSFNRDQALAHSQAALGNQLPAVTLHKSDGTPVSLASYRGKPLVISLIFTSCHHICPTTTQNLNEVVRKARAAVGADGFHVVTIGFDTANDSPERMAQFAAANRVVDPNWDFLAADQATVDQLVKQLGFIYSPSSRGFDHLIQASLVDAKGKVYRQVYGITFPIPLLIEPLKELVYGRPSKQSALAFLENRIRLFCTVYDPATDSYQIDVSVFIGTLVGLIVSLLFGRVLIKEWRRSNEASR